MLVLLLHSVLTTPSPRTASSHSSHGHKAQRQENGSHSATRATSSHDSSLASHFTSARRSRPPPSHSHETQQNVNDANLRSLLTEIKRDIVDEISDRQRVIQEMHHQHVETAVGKIKTTLHGSSPRIREHDGARNVNSFDLPDILEDMKREIVDKISDHRHSMVDSQSQEIERAVAAVKTDVRVSRGSMHGRDAELQVHYINLRRLLLDVKRDIVGEISDHQRVVADTHRQVIDNAMSSLQTELRHSSKTHRRRPTSIVSDVSPHVKKRTSGCSTATTHETSTHIDGRKAV